MPRRVLRPLQEFLHLEASGGLVLLLATAVALVWANVAGASYLDFWSTELTVRLGDFVVVEDLQHVVNDGLMAIFFLVVGLEVKRELAVGELSTRQAALLPLFAAVGGMVVPVLIFLLVMGGADGSRGWGIPMATDVAFALGALAAVGSRAPASLVAFLLGVAVIDDIGAILVVAVYYTDTIALAWLATALIGLIAIVVLQRIQVRYIGVYVVLGLIVWFATFESGVHATIAGVALGLLTPVRPFQDPAAVSAEAIRIAEATDDEPDSPDADAGHWRRLAWLSREAVSPLERVEHSLHQWSSFVVLPIFALANAGIALDRASFEAATDTPVALAVALGLLVGKTVGLTLGVALAVALGLSVLPRGVRWAHVVGVGALAGIGFTVSLFITGLAFSDPDVIAASKIGVLGGSTLAAILGIALLVLAGRRGDAATPDAPPPDP
ncbi:MAG: Na+/H+ antiporter NhaA [Thermoleophilia bacterium]|nr:Na+/H+ antiporter NhaA [Thermoleophilia bacterium]